MENLKGINRRRWDGSIKTGVTEGKKFVVCRLDVNHSGYGNMADRSEHDDKPSGSIKGKKFLDWLVRAIN
jgi:hypothetical protein